MSIYGKAILNPLKPVLPSVQLDTLSQLPRDEGGPVFAEPWQAQAFALAVTLSELGHFTWNEWAATLAGELKADAARGEPEDGSRYYHCWLAALERLVVAKELSNPTTLLARKKAWAEAFRHTPHGMPVELEHDSGAPD
jgi:nitrile hydratase accessory protein